MRVPERGIHVYHACQYLPTNFIEKMLELYESNQTAGIAEPNADMKLSDITGTYEIGSILENHNIIFYNIGL